MLDLDYTAPELIPDVIRSVHGGEPIKIRGTVYVPERTCKPIVELADRLGVGCGTIQMYRKVCSVCGCELTRDHEAKAADLMYIPNYCPECGARVVEE